MTSTAPQLLPYLERLLDGETVEWKTLGEVCDIVKAASKLKSGDYCVSGKVPIIDQGAQYIAGYTDKELATIPKDEYIIFGDHTETIKFVDFEFVQGADGLKILHTKKALSKYVYYAFSNFYKKTASYKRHWSKAKETAIPLPPLRVQARIVDILDKFTQLEAELEAELEARNKQYDFYRNRLLDFALRDDLKGQVEWKTLGEVAELVRGNGLSKKDFSEFGVPAIHYGQIYTYYGNETQETLSFVSPTIAKKLQKVYPGNIVITNTSENIEDVCKAVLYSGNVEAVTGGHATIIRPKDCILPKYLVYYTLTLDFFTQKKRLAKGTKVIDVSAKDLAKIIIPLPPLSEQRRIVEILDRFDTLTNSISEGLPREIALRRKQYEYYRDALLRFPQPAPTV